jgi:MFS family permease
MTMSRNERIPRAAMLRFGLLCLGVWLHSADTLVTATVAPSIVADLGGIAYINWTISLYEVGAIIAGAAAGAFCLKFGIKRVFTGAAAIYAVGCVATAAAPDMAAVIGGRWVQGLGGGMFLSVCYVAVETWFEEALWNRLFGLVALVWGAGSLLGPLIGGVFSGPHRWRWAFCSFALQAVIVWALAQRWLPRSAPAEVPATWPVAPLMLLSAATLIIAESGALSGGAAANRIPLAAAAGVIGLVLLYLAARVDRRSAVRMLPRQMLEPRHPLGAGLLMVFALSAATTGFWAYGPLILNILFGTRPLVTGYILAGEAVAWSVATLAVASATPAADRGLIRGGALVVFAGSAGFAIAVPSGSLVWMVVCGLLQGAGFGACWPAIVQRAVRFADTAERSLASASVSTVQRIGYAVGTAAVGIAANAAGLAEGAPAPAVKAAGFWVFAAFIPVLAMGLVSAWRFTGPRSMLSWYIGTMNDDEFLHALESCELPPEDFGHLAHVRAAYLYLRRLDRDQALDAVRASLQRYVAHLGKVDRYDESMTRRYMELIHRRIVERGDAGGWAAFARNNPDLFAMRL